MAVMLPAVAVGGAKPGTATGTTGAGDTTALLRGVVGGDVAPLDVLAVSMEGPVVADVGATIEAAVATKGAGDAAMLLGAVVV